MNARWLVVLTSAAFAIVFAQPVASAQATHVQWDIVSLTAPPPTLNPGGIASAMAKDGSMITVSGTGTFVAPADGAGSNSSATGGGTWETFAPGGDSTGNGTYWVTGLVRWDQAPGALGVPPFDNTGDPAERSSGLAVLRVEYSDGSHGILVVSCALPGSPPSMSEGISVTKGSVDYFQILSPVPGVDANRTLFHVLQ